jgi:hypothetical protein
MSGNGTRNVGCGVGKCVPLDSNCLFEINGFPLKCRECRVFIGVETPSEFMRNHLGSFLGANDTAMFEETANSIGLE